MGLVPTEPPPGALPPAPASAPMGLDLSPGDTPRTRRRRGLCFRCNRPGHYVVEYPFLPAYANVILPPMSACDPLACALYDGVVYAASILTLPMYHSGGCGSSGGYTSVGGSPPAISPSSPPDLADNGSYAAAFEPHLLTAQAAQKGKAA